MIHTYGGVKITDENYQRQAAQERASAYVEMNRQQMLENGEPLTATEQNYRSVIATALGVLALWGLTTYVVMKGIEADRAEEKAKLEATKEVRAAVAQTVTQNELFELRQMHKAQELYTQDRLEDLATTPRYDLE